MLVLCLLSSITQINCPSYKHKYFAFLILINQQLDLQFRLIKLDASANKHGKLSKKEDLTIKYKITEVLQSKELVTTTALASPHI